MPSLAEKINAYLIVNNISFNYSDYMTGEVNDAPDAILYWNTQALGKQPTTQQLDEAWVVYQGYEIQQQNKQQAESLLQATDWTATVDISNPEYSNPYLMNQNEFLSYRSVVRQVAVKPPSQPVKFPTEPKAIWSEAV